MEHLTAARMREIEEAAIGSGTVTGLELMERAGLGVVEAMVTQWPELATGSHRAVVLCGPGNNGGDGFVVARLLKTRGWKVEVFLYGDPDRLPPDAKANCRRWAASSPVTVLGFPDADPRAIDAFVKSASNLPDAAAGRDDKPTFVVVDALFGIGLTRPLAGLGALTAHWDYLSNFRDLNCARLVAIDLPSGLDTDTGEPLRGDDPFPVLCADLTVTFHGLKPAHTRAEPLCGKVVVHDIGL